MSAQENYSQRTIAQLTETVLGESMSMGALLDLYMSDEHFGPHPSQEVPRLTAPSAAIVAPTPTRKSPREPLSEAEIRGLLRAVVMSAKAADVIGAVEEFWVPGLHVRADLVVIGEDLHAFEIKSHSDTLKRLPRQVTGFSSLFDRCSLVVAPKHLEGAIEQVPTWWGIAVAEGDGLDWQRDPSPNPSVEVERVVRLLWRDEVLSLLEGAGIAPDLIGGRAGMWRQALAAFDPITIRDFVRRALGSRSAWKEEDGRSRFTATPGPAH